MAKTRTSFIAPYLCTRVSHQPSYIIHFWASTLHDSLTTDLYTEVCARLCAPHASTFPSLSRHFASTPFLETARHGQLNNKRGCAHLTHPLCFLVTYSHSVDFVKNETECFILIFNTLTRFSVYLIILLVSKSGVKLY